MSQCASQAMAFYKEVAHTKKVWTIKDAGGFPAPANTDGRRVQPFWSSRSRVLKIIKNIPDYAVFKPCEISWNEFSEKWVPGLVRDNFLIGVNWSGANATGYDLEPEAVREYVEVYIADNVVIKGKM